MEPKEVIAEIHGFREPGAQPAQWSAGLAEFRAADTWRFLR
jgi:hypothetical protein